MKKVYENLEIEVIEFDKKDIITASSTQQIDNGFATYGSFSRYSLPDDYLLG